jgi:MerR family transcriptional regulator, light-induced transcriptional regulator
MEVLSTRELADALGVSESSIKRWADDGVLQASRTAGGHRRIRRADAIRFVRETRGTVVRPALLGLPEAEAAAADEAAGSDADRLGSYLERGAGSLARGLLVQRYLEGQSLASLVDGPIRIALEQIGTLWQHGPDGIFREHRATDDCLLALQQLRLLVPVPANAPIAVGGACAGDPYFVPTLAVATVLAGEGFDAVNLGADTPIEAIDRAVDRLGPRLVWISASAAQQPERLARDIGGLARRLTSQGVPLAVGGRAVAGLRLPAQPGLQEVGSMSELAAFARGLTSAAARPVLPPDVVEL